MEKLAVAEDHDGEGEPYFTEMNIASGKLNGVVFYSYFSEEPVPVSFSCPVEDLLQMEAVSGTGESSGEGSAAVFSQASPGGDGRDVRNSITADSATSTAAEMIRNSFFRGLKFPPSALLERWRKA